MEFTKEDLKVGDICQFSNNSLWQVNGDYLTQICDEETFKWENKHYFLRNLSLDKFTNQLVNRLNFIPVSIDKVYRPKEFVKSLFSHSELQDTSKFELIFDRERDTKKEKELDIAQVCKEIYEWYDSLNNHKFMHDIIDMITNFPRKKWLENVYNPKAAAYIIIKYNEDLEKQNEKEKVIEEVKHRLIGRNISKPSELADTIVNLFYDYDSVQELDSVPKKAEKIIAIYMIF